MTLTGSLSEKAQDKLNGYRARIDTLDEELIALLKQRIEIVNEVGKLKRGDKSLQCFIRSGREADMLRDIFTRFEKSNFHPIAACAIWRQIISASTQHEQPMSIFVASHGYSELSYYAHCYFGEMIPTHRFSTISEGLEMLREQPASLMILPEPSLAPELWEDFAVQAPEELRIFAQIPFLRKNASQPTIYAAANLTPEASKLDSSLFAIKDENGWQYHIIAGYHTAWPKDAIATTGIIEQTRWLGTYGIPLEIGDEE